MGTSRFNQPLIEIPVMSIFARTCTINALGQGLPHLPCFGYDASRDRSSRSLRRNKVIQSMEIEPA